ncbi:MAG: MFS transporter, partial [Caulobacteraceae bacterium]|nr:MFS transporter [Caulobacter sp.]
FFFLRELAPGLRDQVMVSERDRALIEARATADRAAGSGGIAASFGQLLRVDIVASAFGVSVLLLFYYTAVAFGTIYLVTVFHLSIAAANTIGNWAWASNAVALIVAGTASDRLRVRKPFMLAGGIGAALFMIFYLEQAGGPLHYWTLVALTCGQSICVGCAYATWMASFTETVEAVNPAATATGLAIWGWLLRLVVTASFVAIPFVIRSVTPLVQAPHVLGELAKAQAAHVAPAPALLAALGEIKAAAVAAPAQWRSWYWICVAGIVVFLATIALMRGYWSPAAAKAAEERHDAEAQRELERLREAA